MPITKTFAERLVEIEELERRYEDGQPERNLLRERSDAAVRELQEAAGQAQSAVGVVTHAATHSRRI